MGKKDQNLSCLDSNPRPTIHSIQLEPHATSDTTLYLETDGYIGVYTSNYVVGINKRYWGSSSVPLVSPISQKQFCQNVHGCTLFDFFGAVPAECRGVTNCRGTCHGCAHSKVRGKVHGKSTARPTAATTTRPAARPEATTATGPAARPATSPAASSTKTTRGRHRGKTRGKYCGNTRDTCRGSFHGKTRGIYRGKHRV